MSQTQSALPSAVDAYNHLFHNVHAEIFFGKLASFGIQPATEKEASDLLALAGQLRDVDTPEKQAADQSRFSPALAALNSVTATEEQSIKQAAAALSQDPGIYNAVLALKAHEAAVLAGNQ